LKFRNVARWCALAGLGAALAVAAPGSAAPEPATKRLPVCPVTSESTTAPTTAAGPDTPGACQADVSRTPESALDPSRLRESTVTGGYHHLGSATSGEWAGVSGRIGVVDGSVRPGTYDFVAGRFMAKRDMGGGKIAWLEAGWAETGWASPGRQHIYTFNTNTLTWQFYDQYTIKPGDRVWVDLHSDATGTWSAWLWWGNRWNLLTAQKLPIGTSAYIEQYVEVHVDTGKPAKVDVPTVTVDNVQLRGADGAEQYWRNGVATLVGDMAVQRAGGFCLTWLNLYDTWTAGDCPGEVAAVPPSPPPVSDADVVGGDVRDERTLLNLLGGR
jgi:hypothetical protein